MDPPGSAPGPAVSKTAMRLSTLRAHKRREEKTPRRPGAAPGGMEFEIPSARWCATHWLSLQK